MSAAVIIIRIKRIFMFLRERGATSPESAILAAQVPYSDHWYYERLVRYGAVKRAGDRCYLDEALAESYLRSRRKRVLTFVVLATLTFGLFWLVWALI